VAQLKFKDIIRLEILAGTVILAVFVLFDFIPGAQKTYQYFVKSKVETKAADLRMKRENSGKRNEYMQKVHFLDSGLAKLRKELERVEGKLIGEKNLPLVILEIEDIVGLFPIELISLRPLEAEILGEFELQPVEIRFKGTFGEITGLIENLEGSPSVMSVYDVKIDKDPLLYPKLDAHVVALIIFKNERAATELL